LKIIATKKDDFTTFPLKIVVKNVVKSYFIDGPLD